jgi:hypothetical protein
MLPQWPWVVWATALQFPSNGEAIADGVKKKVAEAAARAMAEIRLPIGATDIAAVDFAYRWLQRQNAASALWVTYR